MSTPRQTLADRIKADNKPYRVFAYQHKPGNVLAGHPVVTVFRSEVVPNGKPQWLDHKLTVFAFGSRTEGEKAEAEMDDILDAVCLSIERLPGYTLDSAKRAVFYNDTMSGWHIEVSMTSHNVYRTTILEEGNTHA